MTKIAVTMLIVLKVRINYNKAYPRNKTLPN